LEVEEKSARKRESFRGNPEDREPMRSGVCVMFSDARMIRSVDDVIVGGW
jgi:hypothetical protein